MTAMDDLIRRQARLIVLQALAGQADERLNSDLLLLALEQFGIRKTREWLHDELSWLADMGAIRVSSIAHLRVAELADKGAQHLDRVIQIEGVLRPGRA